MIGLKYFNILIKNESLGKGVQYDIIVDKMIVHVLVNCQFRRYF